MDKTYTVEISADDEEGWFARVVECPGLMTQGDTCEELLANLSEAWALWHECVQEAE